MTIRHDRFTWFPGDLQQTKEGLGRPPLGVSQPILPLTTQEIARMTHVTMAEDDWAHPISATVTRVYPPDQVATEGAWWRVVQQAGLIGIEYLGGGMGYVDRSTAELFPEDPQSGDLLVLHPDGKWVIELQAEDPDDN